ncbi:hypothetical protein LCGC14_2537400, partial [marine sediment metagenome]
AAAGALGRIGDLRATAGLLEALADTDASVRSSAAYALGALAGVRVDCLEGWCDHAEPVTRSLGARVVPALTVAMTDRHGQVRAAAAWALGWMKDTRATLPLVRALKDRDPAVRARGAHSLGLLRDRRATVSLIAALTDRDPQVGAASAKALGHLADPLAAPALIAALRHKDSNVRMEAAGSLGAMKRQDALPALIAVSENDPGLFVRHRAEDAISAILGDEHPDDE